MKKAAYIIALFFAFSFANAQPYTITAYIESDVITSNDESSLQNITYVGQGMNWVFDRRVDDWILINTHLFDVAYDDGIVSQVQVNPEFDISAATMEAEKYAFIIGQLPACLRVGVNKIWIHLGVESFGGGFGGVLIYTGQSAVYDSLNILEEVLVHEATHTALDLSHASSLEWQAAQNLDESFISSYAASSPAIEDLAESFLAWIMVRQCDIRISIQDSLTVSQTIPNRLAYLDSQNFNMYPLCIDLNAMEISNIGTPLDIFLFPNPTSGQFNVKSNISLIGINYFIYGQTGQLVKKGRIIDENMTVDLNSLPIGIYLLSFDEEIKQTFKIIKQ